MKICIFFFSLIQKYTKIKFQFNTLTNSLARCPHCRKVSSVGPDFARLRVRLYLLFGVIFLLVGFGVTFFTLGYAAVSKRH